MAIRKPKIMPPILSDETVLQWHSLHCELITPMYGGGVKSARVDEKMPIRSASIRGQLRSWWRLLAKHKWKLGSADEIQKIEHDLWGGMTTSSIKGQASKIFLRVADFKNLKIEPWAEYEVNRNTGRYRTIPTPNGWANVPYVLFGAQGKKPDLPSAEPPSSLAKAGLTWVTHFAFSHNVTEDEKQKVIETIKWWINFGGVGSRTRRGLGAFKIIDNKDAIFDIQSLTPEDVKLACCELVYLNNTNSEPTQPWIDSIAKLQNFRQGIGFARNGTNDNPGRSRWAEPDSIREITGQAHPRHQIRLTQGNYFPRAAFGLPIIFKFRDDGQAHNDEPAQTSLQPIYEGKLAERMASPIIIRPCFVNGKWKGGCLLLPHDYLQNLELNLIQRNRSFPVNIWDQGHGLQLTPIAQNKAQTPLHAFLTYFKN